MSPFPRLKSISDYRRELPSALSLEKISGNGRSASVQRLSRQTIVTSIFFSSTILPIFTLLPSISFRLPHEWILLSNPTTTDSYICWPLMLPSFSSWTALSHLAMRTLRPLSSNLLLLSCVLTSSGPKVYREYFLQLRRLFFCEHRMREYLLGSISRAKITAMCL